MELVPYKFVTKVVTILDCASSYPEEVKTTTEKVSSLDKNVAYNVFNPLKKEDKKKQVPGGAARNALRDAFEKISKNPYVVNKVIAIGSEKLPKNQKELASLINPIVEDVNRVFPFAPDFVLGTEVIDIIIEANDPKTKEVVQGQAKVVANKTEAKKGDLTFSNFVKNTGWVTIGSEGSVTTIQLNVVIKIFVGKKFDRDFVTETLLKMDELVKGFIKDAESTSFGFLFRSDSYDNEMMAMLIKNNFAVFTNKSKVPNWSTSRTNFDDEVMRGLDGNLCDILLVK